ncbi:MarR family transcriptional regulator [Companilactobacillus allii]|uniref:HTH marR-type domain-containing protein n=1 Tax=Companilactobacillus allii TaxID=1847728 RepID=A0A1P8Q5W9_9LACO|nr:MarR family transcriptional regulator [Companilactobacillus allii]APX73237.1 hypothetical protein BTM29_12070 [Companilactobacillus allii]USQ68049.1 MarR family transcriptional regulator [Companilactobacillus allii]
MKDKNIEKWFDFIGKQRQIENELSNIGDLLSLNEFYVLYFLDLEDNRKLRLQDLQSDIGLSQSAMSRMITRLEAKECGVIKRSTCDDDKRGIYVSLTQKGEETLNRYQPMVVDILKRELH